MATKFKNIALFGANGQLGQAILSSLARNQKQPFNIVAAIPPDATKPSLPNGGNSDGSINIKTCDVFKKSSIADIVKDADIVISALNGKALEAQPTIQDVAADVGVKRFVPSEYGMHHIYRKPNDPMGYVHPLWDLKARVNEQCVRHQAVKEGRMAYTMIGECSIYGCISGTLSDLLLLLDRRAWKNAF